MARVVLGSKIRCGYPRIKSGLGYRVGDWYRIYGNPTWRKRR